MFCALRASLFIFTLAVLATASPIKTSGRCIRIPLSDPPTVTRPDGTFDLEKAVLMGIRTQNNYGQKLINLERNAVREAFNESAKILPLATVPASLQRRNSETLGRATNEWVTGKISIGTPAQTFTVGLDIGSSDIWVTSAQYDASKSTPIPQQRGTFTHIYRTVGRVSGPIYTDNVTFAGVEAKDQHFSSVNLMSINLNHYRIDGILGLGAQVLSTMNQKTFVASAFQQGKIHENAFSIMLARSGSSLFLGGSDNRFFTGPIQYHKVNAGTRTWQLIGATVKVGSTVVSSNVHTILDINSPYIVGPKAAVQRVYDTIPGAKVTEQGYYNFPCNFAPSVSFSWGGKDWMLSNFNLGRTTDRNICIGAIMAHHPDTGENFWSLGSSFLRNVYTTFSFAKNAVGFADLKTISL